MEIWANIKDYEGYYQVSNLGRVKSLEREVLCNGKNQFQSYKDNRHYKGKLIKPTYDKKGYLYAELCKNNTKRKIFIHQLVARAFIPNINNKTQINHKNGIKDDNRVENLEWATPQENIQHAYNYNLFDSQLKYLKQVQQQNQKMIMQYDKNGNFIKEWESIKEARNKLKISSHISDCCNGKRKTAGGYIWIYKKGE